MFVRCNESHTTIKIEFSGKLVTPIAERRYPLAWLHLDYRYEPPMWALRYIPTLSIYPANFWTSHLTNALSKYRTYSGVQLYHLYLPNR